MGRVGILTGRDRVELIAGENPIILNNQSEPQPDVVLLRSRSDYYATGHPQPDDIFLLIEVAQSSIESDRAVKIPLYAHEFYCC
jgi:hypothetical protein